MKFNLSDFLQLDTKGLLAVNGGYNCNGSTNNTVYPNTYYSGNGESPNGGGGNDHNGNKWYSKGDIVDAIPPGGTFIHRGGKDCTYVYGEGKSKYTTSFHKNPDGTYLVTYSHYDGPVSSNGSKNSGGSSGGGSCSTPTTGSNNSNGQGYSQTSSNPGKNSGDKGKKDDTPHGGGTCPGKDGGTHIPPSDDGSGTGDGGTDIPNGGGICGGTGGSGEGEKPDTDGGEITNPDDTIDKTSGLFGQITDGSYADLLTMQYYKNQHTVDGELTDGFSNDKSLYSKEGCLMTSVAKALSQLTNTKITPLDINNKFDSDKNGLLSLDEISNGLNNYLDELYGDIYDVLARDINNVQLEDLKAIATDENSTMTYVLGNAPDCHGGHWVVLEGYNTNSNGVINFIFDGSSDHDLGRTYILGKEGQNISKNVYGITRIETFSIIAKN